MWILIREWPHSSNVMAVMCHWHYEPSIEDIRGMIESGQPNPVEIASGVFQLEECKFFIVKAPSTHTHE